MLRRFVFPVAVAVTLGVASISTGALAFHGGGGFGGGAHAFGGGGFAARGALGGSFAVRGPGIGSFAAPRTFASPNTFAGRPWTGRAFARWGFDHRFRGRRFFGFGVGYPYWGYDYPYYSDSCLVWTDEGWLNVCGYDYPYY
jgi:hypothetical protein